MLKQCALAFARTKPTEWDHFRQEWFSQNLQVTATATIPVSLEPTAETVEVKEEPKPHRYRALKKEEIE